MTGKKLFLAATCMAAAVMFSGCGAATTTVNAGKAVVDDQLSQFEEYVNGATVLPRANEQLRKARESRSKLDELAKQRRVEVEVSKQQVQRLEEESAKSKKAFETVQEAAKAGGLPKLSEATDADKEKQLQIAGQNKAGSEVYAMLKTYKDEVRKVNDAVNREKTKQAFLTGQANTVETQLRSIDDHIDSLERQIEDYKMYQELLTANKKIADLNIPSGKIEQMLNTDNIISGLQRLNDEAAAGFKQVGEANDAGAIKDVINSETAGALSITGDDLL